MTKANVLVVAAHPDDEILGCGGRLAAHADKGNSVHVLILAEGATSRAEVRDAEKDAPAISALRQAAEKALRAIGGQSLSFGNFPDNRMDSVDLIDVIKKIEHEIAATEPSVIYTHHAGDLNVDHRIAAQATMTACRPLPGRRPCSVLAFETVSSTEWALPTPQHVFVPTVYADISRQLDRKLAALELYKSEMRDFPHPRSIEAVRALAAKRGSECGRESAEAFMLLRTIID